ncbi:nuclear transport factor 2 family protein [Lacibacter sp. MH-610]|uniref:nuclear transport factor 2 family protein n=1 Tax=Lacibacter sp. MH-610 TaxID=3020883 RepID=UPI0038913FE6
MHYLSYPSFDFMEQLITKFYTAFAGLDAETMATCYHPEAVFNDEAFVNLRGKEPAQMWKMLIEQSKGELKISFSNVQASSEKGSADWVATYKFSVTGRKVINHIHAEFEFKDGLIYRHTDRFDLHKWARQAMGLKGWLLGGFGFFRKKVRQNARKALDRFIENRG